MAKPTPPIPKQLANKAQAMAIEQSTEELLVDLRSAIAKQPEAVIASELNQLREGGQVTPDMVFRDPYMLDFLGLPDGYSERDLESAILRDMERFLLELCAGFKFVARQKRISVGADAEQVELMDLDSANIRVAQYLHALPELQVLQSQLHRVVQLARERQATSDQPDTKE